MDDINFAASEHGVRVGVHQGNVVTGGQGAGAGLVLVAARNELGLFHLPQCRGVDIRDLAAPDDPDSHPSRRHCLVDLSR